MYPKRGGGKEKEKNAYENSGHQKSNTLQNNKNATVLTKERCIKKKRKEKSRLDLISQEMGIKKMKRK